MEQNSGPETVYWTCLSSWRQRGEEVEICALHGIVGGEDMG